MRKSYAGAAPILSLTGNMLATDTTFATGTISGFPNTSIGPFVVKIAGGTPSEEKILISSYSSNLFSVAQSGRGYDGTIAVPHSTGDAVEHCLDSVTVNEANLLANSLGTVLPSTVTPGAVSGGGVSLTGAAADHTHAVPPYGASGVITISAPGDGAAAGATGDFSDAGHRHGRETASTLTGLVFPSGMIFPYGGTVAPSGFFMCDATAYSRTTYSALFAVIGTTYGAGDGATTFNVPDARGRMLMGVGNLGTNSQPTIFAGETGGANYTTLSTANLAAHSHTINDPGHGHSTSVGTESSPHVHTFPNSYIVNQQASTVGLVTNSNNQAIGILGMQTSNEDRSHIHSVTVNGNGTGITESNVGSGTSFQTISPFLGVSYIIKT